MPCVAERLDDRELADARVALGARLQRAVAAVAGSGSQSGLSFLRVGAVAGDDARVGAVARRGEVKMHAYSRSSGAACTPVWCPACTRGR